MASTYPLSLVAQYDDLIRSYNVLSAGVEKGNKNMYILTIYDNNDKDLKDCFPIILWINILFAI